MLVDGGPADDRKLGLRAALVRTSPRLTPPPPTLRGALIHASIVAVWLALLGRAFLADGLLAWSAGLLYIGYDTALLVFVAWMTRGLRHGPPAHGVATSGRRPSLAVIVAAHDEAGVLPLTLEALFGQADRPDHILVADDGSVDGTGAWLGRVHGLAQPDVGRAATTTRQGTRLTWLRLTRHGKARALNAALERLDEEIVLTVDADTLLEPGAVGAMRAAFAACPALVAATGLLAPVCGPSVSGRLFQWFQTYEYIRNFMSRYAWARTDSLLLISGAFAGFRRSAVVEVGGFDPDCLVEDYELIHRLRRHSVLQGYGWTTDVIGGARARTDAPGAPLPFLNQRRRWFGGFLQTQFWYRDMIGDGRYGWLGLLMLPVKAIDTMQPIYGLSAVVLLLAYLASGRVSLATSIGGVVGLKLAVDLGFHLWSLRLYDRWTGGTERHRLGPALVAALAEPFCFQILRHLGAALGWVAFLTGHRSWRPQARSGLLGGRAAAPASDEVSAALRSPSSAHGPG